MSEIEWFKERVERLEKQSRRKTRLMMSILFGVVAYLVGGQVAPETPKPETKKVIEADEFVIRDNSGKPRIKLGMEASEAGIKIFDRKGKVALELSHLETSSTTYHSHLKFTTSEGTASLGSEGSGGVELSLRSTVAEEPAKPAIDAAKDSSNADIERTSSRKENWLKLSVNKAGADIFIGMDGQQRGAWYASSENTMLFLSDTDGKARGIWNVANGVPTLSLLDGEMKSRLVLGGLELKNKESGAVERRSESSMVLLGEGGNVIFSAP